MKRPLATAIAATALALTAVAAPAASAAPRDFVGITSDETFQQTGDFRLTNLRAIRKAKVGLIRQVFDWSKVETAGGVYDLSYLDQYVAAVAGQGLSIMPVLTNAPSFYKRPGSQRGAIRPTSNGLMAKFAQALVRRYGPRGTLWSENSYLRKVPIRVWQLWNEPSLRVYWGPRPNAREYAAMLRTVAPAIKQVDPSAEIVTAGLPDSKLTSAAPLDRYLKQLYGAGAAKHFDTLAINAYARHSKDLERLLVKVRKLMDNRGDKKTKIWITEVGWGDKGPSHRFIVGRKGQAKRITDSFKTVKKLRAKMKLRGLVYFSWRDGRPYAPLFEDLWGLHTGLLDVQGRRKPAYKAFVKGAGSIR
jgi:hypothetical protein